MARRTTQRPRGTPGQTRRASAARRPGGGPRPQAGARGTRSSAGGERPRLPLWGARRSTRRLAVLGAVFVLLGIMLVPTIRAYLGQRDDMARLAQKVAEQEETVGDLNHQLELWKDPAFIEAQARKRLTFVFPGETAYQVLDVDTVSPAGQSGTRIPGTVPAPATPYYERMMDSIRRADGLPVPSGSTTPAPGSSPGSEATPRASAGSPGANPSATGSARPTGDTVTR